MVQLWLFEDMTVDRMVWRSRIKLVGSRVFCFTFSEYYSCSLVISRSYIFIAIGCFSSLNCCNFFFVLIACCCRRRVFHLFGAEGLLEQCLSI